MKGNRNKRLPSLFLGAVTGIVFLAGSGIEAADSVYTNASIQASAAYDESELEIFYSRTKQEIADQYSAALYAESLYDNNDAGTWYAEEPSIEYPYNPGMISDAAHSSMIAMTNFYRWISGCDPIEAARYSESELPLQTGALVRNFCWQHVVIDSFKPDDMDDELWQKGADCNHNILALDYTPVGAVTAWISEGYDQSIETWKTVGHRAILLDSKLSKMSYGFCGRVAIGTAEMSKNEMELPFTAYPCPGYMPTNVINPTNCAWTAELNDNRFGFDDIEDVKVTITNIRTGQQWVRTYDDSTMIYSYGLITFVQPDDYVDMMYTDSYQVNIEGIYNIETYADTQISYRIDFFDMSDYVQTRVKSADTCCKYMIGSEMMNEDDLTLIASILPNEVNVLADNKQIFKVPIDGEWQVDMLNSCFVAKGDLSQLPDRLSDPKGYLNKIVIPYAVKTDICDIYDTLDIVPQEVNEGGKVSISAYRTNSSTDTVNIFKIIQGADGTYSSQKVFDSGDSSYVNNGTIDGFNIEAASLSDSGEYISIYYDKASMDLRYTVPVYVSNSVSALKVNSSLKYDVNRDGVEDMKDSCALNCMILGTLEVQSSGDVNEDGYVNIFDLALIREYLFALLKQ